MSQLNLLDIAKRNGSDREVGLIEDVVTFSPEFGTLPVRPINGVSFKSTLRTGYASASFRAVGDGVTPGKSTFIQKLAECFYLDAQLQVDEALPDSEDRSAGDVLTDEATSAMRGLAIQGGTQLYYGTAADSNGFQGLRTFVGSGASLSVSAGSSGNTTTTAYLVYIDIKGVHFVAGRTAAARQGIGDPNEPSDEPVIINSPFKMPEWKKQQVVIGTAGKVQTAFVSNIAGWLGLAYGSRYSAFSVRNIGLGTSSTYLTDTMGQKLLSLVPLHIRNSGSIRWLMNRDAAYSLQASRLPTTIVGAVGAGGVFPDRPKSLGEVPIILTDLITTTETNT